MSDIDSRLFFLPKVTFGTHEDLYGLWTVLLGFWKPLIDSMVERPRVGEGETDEEDICVREGKGSESTVLFLTCSVPELSKIIPEPHFDEVAIILDSSQIVVEDCGRILLRETVSGVADQERSLADTTVTKQYDFHCETVLLHF